MSITATVFVVEDDEFVRLFATEHVAACGFHCLQASNGNDAINVLKGEAQVDLLFTDILLGKGINGVELAATARLLRPAIRVLFTSGYAPEAVLNKMPSGAQLLPKPYTARALEARLRSVLA